MTDTTPALPRRDDRVDIGWRGSAVNPRKAKPIEVKGGAGALVAAQLLQKQEEMRLGLPAVDAKELRERRRAGEGSDLLGTSNPGVAQRQEKDKTAILTERDRERILEEKSRTYAALQAGKLYDDNNQYHVNFRPGGMLSEDLDPGTYTFDQRQRPDGIQAEISEGAQHRTAWENEEWHAYEAESAQEVARDAKIAGIKEQERQTQRDRERVARQKEADALADARDKRKLDDFLKDALRKGLLPKKRKKPQSAK